MASPGVAFHVFAANRYPWLGGAMPPDARTAAAWIAAGWEPTEDQIRKMGPARAAALGLEWVKVTAWPPWLLPLGLLVAAVWYFRRRRRARA